MLGRLKAPKSVLLRTYQKSRRRGRRRASDIVGEAEDRKSHEV